MLPWDSINPGLPVRLDVMLLQYPGNVLCVAGAATYPTTGTYYRIS